jgi:hypothetical protein
MVHSDACLIQTGMLNRVDLSVSVHGANYRDISMHAFPSDIDSSFKTTVRNLLEQAGYYGDYVLHVLRGGGNNRVFRIHINGAELLLKSYFTHPADPRDRMQAEVAFSDFAWSHGVRCIPEVLGYDKSQNIALYDYINGGRISSSSLQEDHIDQAVEFFLQINEHRNSPLASRLPVASEACFSIDAHITCIEERLERLFSISGGRSEDDLAVEFISKQLAPCWGRVKAAVNERAVQDEFDLSAELSREDRCVSPSDFGFHNAICRPDGHVVFIDFEYAGWDDPAKMICDFFSQPEVPSPLRHLMPFAERTLTDVAYPERALERVLLLMPAYTVKWCCILMNDFLPADGARRSFAQGEESLPVRLEDQLQKAQAALQRLTELQEWEGALHGLH